MAVRIGFVGTGGIAQMHMRNLQRIPEAQVIGVFDVAADRAQTAAAMFPGCKAYDSHSALIREAKPQAIYVCLPPFAHEQQELDAAAAGIHLFVEKPIAVNVEKAVEISAAIKRAGIIAAVGYNWRWLDITQRAKDILATTPIAMAQGYWWGGMPGVSWWRRKEQSGGQIVEQTTHIYDLARYLLGDVKRVYAAGFRGMLKDVEHYSVEDASTVVLHFESGAIANISSTDLLPGNASKLGIDLIGRDVRIEHTHRQLSVYRPGERMVYDSQMDPYLLEDQTFVQAVASGNGAALLSTYPDALRTHMVTMAANRSLETGQVEAVQSI